MEKLFSEMSTMELVVAGVLGLNLALTLVAQFLDWLKGKTKSDADDKVSVKLHGFLNFLSKIIDWLSANKKH